MKKLVLLISLAISVQAFAQNLLQEKIRKITTSKKSIYLDGGIFHNGESSVKSKLVGIRHSYNKNDKTERIVFDFSTSEIPKIYGYFSGKDQLVTIDFFGTEIAPSVSSFGNSNFVKDVNFFPVTPESLSAEMRLKSKGSVDIFYLQSPGRLVIDLKI